MDFSKMDGPEPDPDWTPTEAWVAISFIVVLSLAGAAFVWFQSVAGG